MTLCLIPLLLAMPTIERVRTPSGGIPWTWTDDLTLAAGTVGDGLDCRLFAWTRETGWVWLDALVDVPDYPTLLMARSNPDEWVILLSSGVLDAERHIVRLPRDTSQWFRQCDYDHDGDVDQVDFGLWQVRQDVPSETIIGQMGGPR